MQCFVKKASKRWVSIRSVLNSWVQDTQSELFFSPGMEVEDIGQKRVLRERRQVSGMGKGQPEESGGRIRLNRNQGEL